MQQGGKGRILLRSALPTCPGLARPPAPKAGASSFGEFMTSDDSLSLILRRLDEIQSKLDRVLEELRTPAAHRLFGAPWQSSKEGLNRPVLILAGGGLLACAGRCLSH
jgi:hypothetical protein